MEAIILAGGLGTRLRSVVSDVPKCMAMVAGKPFIHYILHELIKNGITTFIFSVGYKHQVIQDYIKDQYPYLDTKFVLEDEPLGTGGAVKLACKTTTKKNVFIVNGDTLFTINFTVLLQLHLLNNADCTLALKPMQNFDRYGVVTINKTQTITSFKEKKYYNQGLINGGIYLLNVEYFLQKKLPNKFSFEAEYLETFYIENRMFGLKQDCYFIDIGIPIDFEKANKELINKYDQ
jgi:D-glycero-alpha-D-manno-heptose 1-phosphate guanylyltransferase